MSSRSLMKHLATISRSATVNADGYTLKSWSELANNVPCLLQEGSGTVRRDASGAGLEYSAIAFFPPDTDLRPNNLQDEPDQIVITHPPALADRKFLVKLVVDESGMGDHLTAYLDRVRKG